MASGREIHLPVLSPELSGDQTEAVQAHDWERALRQWADQTLARGQHQLLSEAVPAFERVLIKTALKHTAGRKRDAAQLLGWGRHNLTRKLKGLDVAYRCHSRHHSTT